LIMTRSLFGDYREKSSGNTSNNGRDEKRQHQDELMEEITLSYLSKMEEDSFFFGKDFNMEISSRLIPQFDPREIELETMIGMGEYGTVTRVAAIHLEFDDKGSNIEGWKHADTDGDEDDDGDNSIKKMNQANATVEKSMGSDITNSGGDTVRQQPRRKLFPSSNCLPVLLPEIKNIEQAPKSWGAEDITAPQGNNILVSQSITVAQLAVPTIPMNERHDMIFSSSRTRRRSSVLSPDVLAMAGSTEEQSLRRKVADESDNECHHHHEISSRFALKQIRKDLYPKKKCEAAKDLAREAKFLARLSHPNIICLRGLVSQPGNSAFGLLLDRLRITLSEEAVLWKSRQAEIVSSSRSVLVSPIETFAANLVAKWPFWQPNGNHSNNSFRTTSDMQNDSRASAELSFQCHQYSKEAICLMGERLLALHDVAQALEYLQFRKIIFRDLKPENVAMLGKQRFQLFDFGLAKECKAVDRWIAGGKNQDQNLDASELPPESDAVGFKPNDTTDGIMMGFYDTYKMTGLTGTLRIMSPETIQCLPYGLPADVFSFGICMWEVFAGDRCSFLTAGDIVRGDRPAVPLFDSQCGVGLPPDLASFLKQCWAADQMKRPNFVQICRKLKSQLMMLRQNASRPRSRSSNMDSVTIGAQGLFWDRLESIQQPIIFEKNGTETATLVQ
jgi:serine/threonine protein kinase